MSGRTGSAGGECEARDPRESSTWFVYILRCADGSLYTGISNRLDERLRAHAEGRGAKYTRSRLPIELIFRETRPDRSAALRREAEIKTYTRAEKMALIASTTAGGALYRED